MTSCAPSSGDRAVYELINKLRRYPLVRINATTYLMEAVKDYFKEARERGCAVDEQLKSYVVDRIRTIMREHGLDPTDMVAYDLHGVDKDVVDVIRMLGVRTRGLTVEAPPSPPSSFHAENCIPQMGHYARAGDYAVLELVSMKRRYPLAKINVATYLIDAITKYLREARERGCAVDQRLKKYVADRIRSLLREHGVDISSETAYDLHGISEDVLDVIRMLGVKIEERPPLVPAQRVGEALEGSAASIEVRRAPRRRRSKALQVAVVLAVVLIVALTAMPQLVQFAFVRAPNQSTSFSWISTTTTPTQGLISTQQQTLITLPSPVAPIPPPSPILPYTITTLMPNYVNSLDSPIIRAAFDALNRYRVENSVPPVEFTQLRTSLYRALYMYNNSLFSHYDKEGRHPTYYFTSLDGGIYGVEENLHMSECPGGACIKDAAREAERAIYSMVYEDAESDWGHRDSLLNPCNNKASIAVVWDSYRFYLVVYMVSDWAEWIERPHYADGTFSLRGYLRLPPTASFYGIFIYRDVPNPDYVKRRSYSIGKLYAGVLPPDYRGRYQDIATIYADRYIIRQEGSRWYVDIAFRFTPSDEALYTIAMFSRSPGIKWTPLSGRSTDVCTIFEYTIAS